MDLHRIHGSSVTSLFSKNSLDLKSIVIPGPKVKVKKERDFIGIDMMKVKYVLFYLFVIFNKM